MSCNISFGSGQHAKISAGKPKLVHLGDATTPVARNMKSMTGKENFPSSTEMPPKNYAISFSVIPFL